MFKKVLNTFKKKSYINRIIQYYTLFGYSQYSFSDFLLAQKSIVYYFNTAPVYKSINLIANLISTLPFILKDKNSGETIEEHALLDLLKNPSSGITEKEFKFQYAVNLQITGNNFNLVSAIDNINEKSIRRTDIKEPLFVMNISPMQVGCAGKTNSKGKIDFYTVTNLDGTLRQYNLNETIIGSGTNIKRIDLYLDNKNRNLWHTKLYNPNATQLWGLSPLMSLILTMDSYNESTNHNLSLLRNGARPTGLLSYKGEGELQKETYDMLKRDFQKCHTGTDNAGNVILADGNFEFQEMGLSPKEMDWIKGKQVSKEDIYLNLGIPLALIDSKASTFNNYFTALYSLYEHTVFPLMDKIIGELSDMLLWRYKDGDKFILTYSKENIPSLDSIKTESVLNKAKSGIYTINELREMQGLEPLKEGGDALANNFSQNVPINSSENQEEQIIEAAQKSFTKTLKNAGFCEKDILNMIKDLK